MTRQYVKSVLKGTLFFVLVGPLLGGLLVFLLIGFRNGFSGGTPITITGIAGQILFFGGFAYAFGTVPALVTGLVACSLQHRMRSGTAFVALCTLVSVIFGFVYDGIFYSIATTPGAHTPVFAILNIIPAIVTGTLWWKIHKPSPKLTL